MRKGEQKKAALPDLTETCREFVKDKRFENVGKLEGLSVERDKDGRDVCVFRTTYALGDALTKKYKDLGIPNLPQEPVPAVLKLFFEKGTRPTFWIIANDPKGPSSNGTFSVFGTFDPSPPTPPKKESEK